MNRSNILYIYTFGDDYRLYGICHNWAFDDNIQGQLPQLTRPVQGSTKEKYLLLNHYSTFIEPLTSHTPRNTFGLLDGMDDECVITIF